MHIGCSLLRDMRTVPVNSNDASPWESRASGLQAVLGRCVGVKYPVVGCDYVNMALFHGEMQRCYKYPPTPLSEHKVMCTAHGPFFTRLRYTLLEDYCNDVNDNGN